MTQRGGLADPSAESARTEPPGSTQHEDGPTVMTTMTQELGLDATPVLRLARLEEVTLGEADFERELLDCLIADLVEGIGRLREALRGPEPARAAVVLHGIVGACRTLGADALGESSRALELQAKQPGFAPGPGWLDPVDREFGRLRDVVVARLGP